MRTDFASSGPTTSEIILSESAHVAVVAFSSRFANGAATTDAVRMLMRRIEVYILLDAAVNFLVQAQSRCCCELVLWLALNIISGNQ